MERARRTPALIGSALLHGGLLAAVLFTVKAAPPLTLPSEPVAVSIVSGAPNVSPALASPEPTPPQAEAPAAAMALPGPEAPTAAPAAAAPAPVVVKPPPQPKPAPTPPAPPKPVIAKPPTPTPAPPKPQALAKPLNLDTLSASLPKAAAKPRASLDLDALSASLPKQPSRRAGAGALNLDALADSLPAGRRAGNGTRGPARPETAAVARQATGAATGLTGNELGALRAKLKRLWTPNCGLEGVQSIVIKVAFGLGPQGQVQTPPRVISKSGDVPQSVLDVAAQRAVSAVLRGEPFDEIAPEHLKGLGNIAVTFDKPC